MITVIAGPTGSGKTSLAIELAQRLDAEIVGADSQQVYRHFDIGTAKPTPAQLAAVPHHLISVIEPLDTFSAVRFQAMADRAIADIHARGKQVVVVGGTGLYLRVLLHGAVEVAGANPRLRSELEALAEREGRQAVHARLAAVDPETARALPTSDLVRVIRALEIHAQTGVPASVHRSRHRFAPTRHPFRMFVLDPPRDVLYPAINQRTRAMFDAGLVEETRALIERGFREAAPMQSVGYVQALAVIDARMTLEEAIEDAARESRRYAKRQLTWFRREQGARFLTPPFSELRAPALER